MKHIINIVFWGVIAIYLVVVLGFVSIKHEEVLCTDIEVGITDETENFFIQAADVKSLITAGEEKLLGYSIDSVNTARIEDLIYEHPSIKRAEVYTTIRGVLKVDIEQRNPILRIINYNGESYYIDEEGALMPLSDQYSAHVLIANGNINEPYALRYTKSILELEEEDEMGRKFMLKDLYTLAKFIYQNEFWKSQIEQVYVNRDNDIELVPKVGPHVILFGDVSDYELKFRKLEALYKQGLAREGWNKYKKINLKYKQQVICTKWQ